MSTESARREVESQRLLQFPMIELDDDDDACCRVLLECVLGREVAEQLVVELLIDRLYCSYLMPTRT